MKRFTGARNYKILKFRRLKTKNSVNLSENSVKLSEYSVNLSESRAKLSEYSVNLSENRAKLSKNSVNLSVSRIYILLLLNISRVPKLKPNKDLNGFTVVRTLVSTQFKYVKSSKKRVVHSCRSLHWRLSLTIKFYFKL